MNGDGHGPGPGGPDGTLGRLWSRSSVSSVPVPWEYAGRVVVGVRRSGLGSFETLLSATLFDADDVNRSSTRSRSFNSYLYYCRGRSKKCPWCRWSVAFDLRRLW